GGGVAGRGRPAMAAPRSGHASLETAGCPPSRMRLVRTSRSGTHEERVMLGIGRIAASVRDWIGAAAVREPVAAPAAPAVLEPAGYAAAETLRDGRALDIRAFRPGDKAELEAAVGNVSTQTLY